MFLEMNDFFNLSSWASFSIQELLHLTSVKSIENKVLQTKFSSRGSNEI